MAEIVVSMCLEEAGETVMDEALAQFVTEIVRGVEAKEAMASASLSEAQVRAWRRRVRRLRGRDPLKASGKGFKLTEVGKILAAEFQRKSSRVKVQLASGVKIPLLAVDGLLLHQGKLIAIKRKYFPFQGSYCLPGGMVEYGETVEEAVMREVEEETGLKTRVSFLVGVYSNPDRDPRGHVISLAFALEAVSGDLSSGTDAAQVALLDLEELPELGFDHSTILGDYLKRVKG